jgi:hypothetical protein
MTASLSAGNWKLSSVHQSRSCTVSGARRMLHKPFISKRDARPTLAYGMNFNKSNRVGDEEKIAEKD